MNMPTYRVGDIMCEPWRLCEALEATVIPRLTKIIRSGITFR